MTTARTLKALADFRDKHAATVLRIHCDTSGCEHIHPGPWESAVDEGWRADTGRMRRCPGCLKTPLVQTFMKALDLPPVVLLSDRAADPGVLLPAPAGPQPSAPLPAGGWAIAVTVPADASADEKAAAILARFNAAHDEENGKFSEPDEEGISWRLIPDDPGPAPAQTPPAPAPFTPAPSHGAGPGSPDQDEAN
jgi:hypothetical protein